VLADEIVAWSIVFWSIVQCVFPSFTETECSKTPS